MSFDPQDAKILGAIDEALASGQTQVANELVSVMRQNRLRRDPSFGMPTPVNIGQAGMPAAIKSVMG